MQLNYQAKNDKRIQNEKKNIERKCYNIYSGLWGRVQARATHPTANSPNRLLASYFNSCKAQHIFPMNNTQRGDALRKNSWGETSVVASTNNWF